MANTQQNDTQNAKIQSLLARYLELRSKSSDANIRNGHLDEDTLNAFTEGTVSEREAWPIVNHLSDCNFCRHKTTELVRLDLEFADMDAPRDGPRIERTCKRFERAERNFVTHIRFGRVGGFCSRRKERRRR